MTEFLAGIAWQSAAVMAAGAAILVFYVLKGGGQRTCGPDDDWIGGSNFGCLVMCLGWALLLASLACRAFR